MARGWAWEAWRLVAGGAVIASIAVVAFAGGARATECVATLVSCNAPTTPPPTAPPPDPQPSPAPQPAPQPSPAEARARLVADVNAERTQRGLGPLAVRDDVTSIAGGWSDAMARAGTLSHNDAYFTDDSHRRLGAQLLGENVARADDIDVAHRALMASDHHRANILDARFTVIGVGATLVDGTWWITEDFLQPVAVKAAASRVARVTRVARPRVVSVASTSTTAAVVASTSAPVIDAAAAEPAHTVAVLPKVDHTPMLADLASSHPAPSSSPAVVVVAVALVVLVGAALLRQLRLR